MQIADQKALIEQLVGGLEKVKSYLGKHYYPKMGGEFHGGKCDCGNCRLYRELEPIFAAVENLSGVVQTKTEAKKI